MFQRLTDGIRDLEYDRVSGYSHKSGSVRSLSVKSATSDEIKQQLAGEIASLKTKLKFSNAIAKQKAELEHIETIMQIEQASAKIDAMSNTENESPKLDFVSSNLNPNAVVYKPELVIGPTNVGLTNADGHNNDASNTVPKTPQISVQSENPLSNNTLISIMKDFFRLC